MTYVSEYWIEYRKIVQRMNVAKMRIALIVATMKRNRLR